MGIASWVQEHLPPAFAETLMQLKRSVRPSPGYQRMQSIFQQVGQPREPFKGMRYIDPAAHLPKVLGTFENELRGAVDRLCALQPDVIINIGTAEGYYAVGLARRLPQAKVLGYDISTLARHRLSRLSQINAVESRVEPRGYCSPQELDRVCRESTRPAILIDCEGCEWDLLDPSQAPSLSRAIILVELHEMCRPKVTAEIESRFRGSHQFTRIQSTPRTQRDLPAGVTLNDDDAKLAMEEGRLEEQEWMLLVPNHLAS